MYLDLFFILVCTNAKYYADIYTWVSLMGFFFN
jgi:hypothetical protein